MKLPSNALLPTLVFWSLVHFASPAHGSTAWPEEGTALSAADIEALRADGLGQINGPDGVPRFVIDDQHFRQDEVRLAGFSARPWTNGRLVYTFSRYVSEANRQRFRNACAEWTRVANVRCVRRTNEPVYLFVRNSGGNSADVGMPRRGIAYLSITIGDRNSSSLTRSATHWVSRMNSVEQGVASSSESCGTIYGLGPGGLTSTNTAQQISRPTISAPSCITTTSLRKANRQWWPIDDDPRPPAT